MLTHITAQGPTVFSTLILLLPQGPTLIMSETPLLLRLSTKVSSG